MKELQDLTTIIAHAMPKKMLVEMLDEKIKTYKSEPTDENFKEVVFYCHLVLSHELSNTQGLEKLQQEMADIEAAKNNVSAKEPHERL